MEENVKINIDDANEVAEYVIKILDDKKAHNIKYLKVDEKTSIAEYFIICSATSKTQMKALSDEVEYKLNLQGINCHVEGKDSGWTLLDLGFIIVHIFSLEARDFYKLDKMYDDTNSIDIKNIIK